MIPNWVKMLRARLDSWSARRRQARERARLERRFAEHWEDRPMDAEENAATQPPSEESINIWCLWVVEFYGPSQVQNLIEGLERLGLSTPKYEDRQSVIDFLQRSRQRGYTGSWIRLGVIHRPDYKGWTEGVRIELPRGVDRAIGTMLQILPSVTAVVMQFLFDDETVGCLHEILQETHATTTRPLPSGGYQIITATFQKRDELAAARTSLRRRCEFWFESQLPGVFSASSLQTRFPACEFVTVKKAIPFIDPGPGERRRYMELLGLERTWDAWKCEQIPALKLGSRAFEWPGGGEYLTLAANETELAAWATGQSRPITPSAMAGTLDEFVQWLAAWSLLGLLRHHSKSVLTLRDHALRDATARWFSKALRQTEHELLQLRPDVVSFVEDMTSEQQTGEILRDAEFKFEAIDTRQASTRELLQLVLDRVQVEAKGLNQGIRTATDDFMTSVSLRHQSALTSYTLAILLLTIVLILVELFGSGRAAGK